MTGFPDDSQSLAPVGDIVGSGSGVVPAGGFLSFDDVLPTAGYSHLCLMFTVDQDFVNVTFGQVADPLVSGSPSTPTVPLSLYNRSVTVRNKGQAVSGLLFESSAAAAANITWSLFGLNGQINPEPWRIAPRIATPGANTLLETPCFVHAVNVTNNTNVDGQYVNLGDSTTAISALSYDTRVSLRAYETKQLVFPGSGWLIFYWLRLWNSGAAVGDVECSAVYSYLP